MIAPHGKVTMKPTTKTCTLVAVMAVLVVASGCTEPREGPVPTFEKLKKALIERDRVTVFDLLPVALQRSYIRMTQGQVRDSRTRGELAHYARILHCSVEELESASGRQIVERWLQPFLASMQRPEFIPEFVVQVDVKRDEDGDPLPEVVEYLAPDRAIVHAVYGQGAIPVGYEFVMVGGKWFWRCPIPAFD